MRALALAALIAALAASLAAPAAAEEPGAWRLQSALQARTNSLGIGLLTYSGYRVKLFDSENILLKGAFAEAGVVTQLSPASFHPGVYVQVAPVTPLVFRFAARKLGYFGLFGTVVEYPSATSDWSPSALDDNARYAEPAVGAAWEASGMLRLKFGRVLVLHEQQLHGLRMDAVAADHFWYESINDLLVASHDQVHVMKATGAVLVDGRLDDTVLVLGGHWESYAARESGSTRQITGLVGLWRPRMDWWGEPSFAALAGVMLEDKYRQWTPYIGGQAIVTFGGVE
ncbi:MAG: hypothetical protein R3F43_08395 [bacterium]